MDSPHLADEALIDPISLLRPRARRFYEAVMIALALAVLALLPLPSTGWVGKVNTGIWALFLADYVIRLVRSQDRAAFIHTNWIDLIAVLPLDFLRAARVLRVVRLLRLLRAGNVLWRLSANVRGVLSTNGLTPVLGVSTALILGGGLAIWLIEPEIASFGDGVWWSLVTTTTVGYGDLSPVTGLGRALAGILMLVGIGTIGMITASIATYFINHRQPGLDPHVEFIRTELLRWPGLAQRERTRLALLLADLAADSDVGAAHDGQSAALPKRGAT